MIKCLCFDRVKNSENCTFRFKKLYVSFSRLYRSPASLFSQPYVLSRPLRPSENETRKAAAIRGTIRREVRPSVRPDDPFLPLSRFRNDETFPNLPDCNFRIPPQFPRVRARNSYPSCPVLPGTEAIGTNTVRKKRDASGNRKAEGTRPSNRTQRLGSPLSRAACGYPSTETLKNSTTPITCPSSSATTIEWILFRRIISSAAVMRASGAMVFGSRDMISRARILKKFSL